MMPLVGYAVAAMVRDAAPLALALIANPSGHSFTPAEAMEHALAARAVETPDLPAEVLLAVALHESGLDGRSSPRGRWNPAVTHAPRRKHYICGALQVTYEVKPARRAAPPTSEERETAWSWCLYGMDTFVSYADAVDDRPGLQSLGRWARICRERYAARSVTACAVSAHARGGRAGRAQRSELWTYVRRVATMLHRAAGRRTQAPVRSEPAS